MSNSQAQSLDENAEILPVTEASPEFLYCEKEREAVERLLSAGPQAFYSSIDTERSGCFLSSEEVGQITSWAQDYRFTPLEQIQRDENGDGSTEMDEFCSTYFPSCSDTPAPMLELGWPIKSPWVPLASVTVHTSPPADGEPPVREIIRMNLQKACRVIAIVTDRLTDGAIIGDLHNAASRGVPVYIILNQRSIQENFTLNRLRHPNMQVRVIGGKTFCSRTGRMVVGEMKPKFFLVDLETVIHGSYSPTWTDAHLHRQLITILRGPVVDSFDREFRIIFAASLPIPDPWRVEGSHMGVAHRPKDFSHLGFPKNLPLETDITSPPSPPADSLLDWEAMGVVQRESHFPESPLDEHEEIMAKEMPLQNNVPFDNYTPIMDAYTNKGNTFVDKKRISENTSPGMNNLPIKSNWFNNAQPTPADLTSAERRSVEHIVDRAISRRRSIEKSSNEGERTAELTHNNAVLSSSERGEYSRREPILEEEGGIDKKMENKPSSRRPIILRVPQSESFSSLSDIMKRIQVRSSTSGLLKRGSRGAMSEMSQSMVDLSVQNTDTNHEEKGVPMPRLKASCYDPGHMTPAVALMKTRNNAIQRAPKTFFQIDRPSNSRYALNMDWRRSLAERQGEHE